MSCLRLVVGLVVAALLVVLVAMFLAAPAPPPIPDPSAGPDVRATPEGTPVVPSGSPTSTATSAPATTCTIRGPLPDPVCTPGATDPRVTQDNITSTICVSGYTRTVRPPATYTNALKIDQMRAYGFTGTPGDYEEDHLIALELGGAPSDPKNLWPEPRRSIGGRAEDKDQVENYLHAEVCAGRITLAEAQRRIATDWTTAR
jgi:hypothetical protein